MGGRAGGESGGPLLISQVCSVVISALVRSPYSVSSAWMTASPHQSLQGTGQAIYFGGWVHVGGFFFKHTVPLKCWTKCIPSICSLSCSATSKAFRGWQRNCLPVIKMCCCFKRTISIYISMYMNTFLYCIPWACCTTVLLNYDRPEVWSVNCFIVCYEVTEVLWMGFFFFSCAFKPLWKINVIRTFRYICHH